MSTLSTLPTPEELAAFRDALAEQLECLQDEIAPRVFKAAIYDEPQTVTWEHIGSLAVFARDIGTLASWFAETAKKIEETTFGNLDPIRENGRAVHMPIYTEYGGHFDEDAALDKEIRVTLNEGADA